MSVKLLTEHHLGFLSLTGSSESTLVKIPDCWKSHVTDQIVNNDNNFHTAHLETVLPRFHCLIPLICPL